jgi:hypothetical protein
MQSYTRGPLTNREWEAIATPAKLPAAARAPIQRAIDAYWSLKWEWTTWPHSSRTWARLDHVASRAKKLSSLLSNLDDREKLSLSIAANIDPDRFDSDIDTHLKNIIAALDRFADHAEEAAREAQSDEHSHYERPTGFLVAMLNKILFEYTGMRIGRSKAPEAFVYCVCEVADPSLRNETIDEVLKAHIRILKDVDDVRSEPSNRTEKSQS